MFFKVKTHRRRGARLNGTRSSFPHLPTRASTSCCRRCWRRPRPTRLMILVMPLKSTIPFRVLTIGWRRIYCVLKSAWNRKRNHVLPKTTLFFAIQKQKGTTISSNTFLKTFYSTLSLSPVSRCKSHHSHHALTNTRLYIYITKNTFFFIHSNLSPPPSTPSTMTQHTLGIEPPKKKRVQKQNKSHTLIAIYSPHNCKYACYVHIPSNLNKKKTKNIVKDQTCRFWFKSDVH